MNDIDALLLGLDAEPGTRLTPAEAARSDQLLAQITTRAPSVPVAHAGARRAAVPRRARARLTLGVAGVAAAVAIGVAASGQFSGHTAGHQTGQAQAASGLTPAELAAWTATPLHPAATAPAIERIADACLSTLDPRHPGADVEVSGVDQRGSVITLSATDPVSRTRVWCLATSQNPVFSEVVDTPQSPLPAIGAGAVNVQGSAFRGSGRDEISFAFGQAGTDVTGLKLTTPAGETIIPTVQNGLWSLWWPPRDSSTGDFSGATMTWKTADGTSHSAPLMSLHTIPLPQPTIATATALLRRVMWVDPGVSA